MSRRGDAFPGFRLTSVHSVVMPELQTAENIRNLLEIHKPTAVPTLWEIHLLWSVCASHHLCSFLITFYFLLLLFLNQVKNTFVAYLDAKFVALFFFYNFFFMQSLGTGPPLRGIHSVSEPNAIRGCFWGSNKVPIHSPISTGVWARGTCDPKGRPEKSYENEPGSVYGARRTASWLNNVRGFESRRKLRINSRVRRGSLCIVFTPFNLQCNFRKCYKESERERARERENKDTETEHSVFAQKCGFGDQYVYV